MRTRAQGIGILMAAAAAFVAAGCATPGGGPAAQAELKPTQNNAATGWVRFEPRGDLLLVTAQVSGLKPNAEHGFHVHEKGDCSAPDAMSAGGHFNPGGKPHGHHGQAERHGGDLPNLQADAYGVAKYSAMTDLLSASAGAANSVLGRAVVVHRDPDDYKSQPAGNSGPRIACGVVAGR